MPNRLLPPIDPRARCRIASSGSTRVAHNAGPMPKMIAVTTPTPIVKRHHAVVERDLDPVREPAALVDRDRIDDRARRPRADDQRRARR